MITDQGRWDDRDYYDEHFYDIMYDKITEGMKLTVMTNTLRSVGLSIHTKIQNFQMIQWK